MEEIVLHLKENPTHHRFSYIQIARKY